MVQAWNSYMGLRFLGSWNNLHTKIWYYVSLLDMSRLLLLLFTFFYVYE